MNPLEAEEESRSALDRELDGALEDSFPASDAPANTVVTGTHVVPSPPSSVVTENHEVTVTGSTSKCPPTQTMPRRDDRR